MNFTTNSTDQKKTVSMFTRIWIAASFVICAYISFFAIPTLVERSNFEEVDLRFATKDSNETTYYLNKEPYRSRYLIKSSEKDSLFITKCDLLPRQQKSKCDSKKNWSRIPISEMNCDSLENCEISTIHLSEAEREDYLFDIESKDGSLIDIDAKKEFTFENPNTWGHLAPFLTFMLTVFLSFKFGRAVGDFLFKPYT